MCDDKLLSTLRGRQVKPTELRCTQNTSCWCNDLSFRFPMEQIQEECMSPTEMLKTFGSEMSAIDRKYLISLSHHRFVTQ